MKIVPHQSCDGLFEKLKSLYLSVASQRTGIARMPDEITDDYIHSIIQSVQKNGIGFVALSEFGDCLGDIHAEYSSVYIFRNVLWNLTVGVDPAHQGKGIGKKLFGALITEARKNPSLERIELFCKERNRGAIRLYESMGFSIEGVLRNRTNLDGKPEHDLVMGYLP